MRVLLCVFGMLALAAPVAAQVSWLDSPPASWNVPGSAIPLAPPLQNPDVGVSDA